MATGALDANGIWQFGEDDSETTFSALLNKLGGSTSTTVTRLEEMGGITSTQAATARDNLRVGLVPISPSSVVIATGSGSANTLGQVSFTGATAISLNDVFSSSYKAYRVLLSIGTATATADVKVKFRTGGTDSTLLNSASFYTKTANNGAVSGAVTAALVDAKILSIVNSTVLPDSLSIDVFNPFETKQTVANFTGYGNDASGHTVWGSVIVQNTTSFDGFTLTISSGNATGTVQVFGYND